MTSLKTIVLVDRGDSTDEAARLQECVGQALAPFAARQASAPRPVRCWCVGLTARARSRDDVDERFASRFGALRERGRLACAIHSLPMSSNGPPRGIRREWDQLALVHQRDLMQSTANIPAAQRPELSCPDCRGSGQRVTQTNPNGRWASWTIGGQFAGQLTGLGGCCGPTVHTARTALGGQPRLARPAPLSGPAAHLAVCGLPVAVPVDRPAARSTSTPMSSGGNVAPVRALDLSRVDCAALVTTDGRWHQPTATDSLGRLVIERTSEQWQSELLELLMDHADAVAVCVECRLPIPDAIRAT